MAGEQVFRFLDLPKELRLMVYECLPVRTAHQIVQTDDFTFWSENHHTQLSHLAKYFLEDGPRFRTPSSEWPVYSIKVVHKTIPGLAILRTCQRINSEAGVILHPKLRAISKLPAQIIVNSISLQSFDMENVVNRLSYANTAYWTNKSRLLDWYVQAPELRPVNEPRSRPVHIAIRNSFPDRDTASAQICEVRMECLWLYFYGLLYHDLTMRRRTTRRLFPHINRHLHIRMAGLTSKEKKAYDKCQPLELSRVGTCGHCTSTLAIDSGEIIQDEEWDNEWAEGMRL